MDPPNHSNVGMNVVVYGATFLVGAGGATVLVTSLSMVADLIGGATVSPCGPLLILSEALQ